MRTLIVSDLHLGLGRRRAVLESPTVLEHLLDALDGVGRLILLGDTVELTQRPRGRSLATAEPVLRAIGRRLGGDAEVVVVPGNHDRPLVGRWLRREADGLGLDTPVPSDASPELERLLGTLAPARVTVRYPGLWLDEGLWATHGHYLNHHLIPDSAYGWLRARIGRPESEQARPVEYESRSAGRRRDEHHATIGRLGRLLTSSLPDAVQPRRLLSHLVDPRLAPILAPLLSAQMQHASVPAMARVAARLDVGADRIVFGHVHRLGPRDGDSPDAWSGGGGTPALLNTGSWVYEPALLHRASPPHPYWPGGAVVLDPGEPPRAVGLLDDLDAGALRARS